MDKTESISKNESRSIVEEEKTTATEKSQPTSNNRIAIEIANNNGVAAGEVNYHFTLNKFKDPTTIWNFSDSDTEYKIDEKEIGCYANSLIKNNLIVLQCEDKRIIQNTIESIVDHIIMNKKIQNSQKRLFSIQRSDKDIDKDKPYEENHESFTLSTFIQEKLTKDTPSFIKTKLIQSEFFKSLFIEEKESFEAIKEELKNKNIYFICYVQEKALINTIQNKRQFSASTHINNTERNFFFPFHKIPFLPIILQFHFKERWTEIRDALINQKEQGYWGGGKTDKELYDGIINYLEAGTHKLENEIENRRKSDFRKNLEKRIYNLPLNQKLHKHILFITAYFPKISIAEFKILVNLLLEGKTEEIQKNNKPNESENKSESHYEPQTIQLSEKWNEQGDEILSNCEIVSSNLENGRIYFDFKEPELKDEIRSILQKQHFLFFEEQFKRIINSGIFFETKLSKQFIQNIIENITSMVSYDPYLYGLKLLCWIFDSIFDDNKIHSKKNLEEPNEDELEWAYNFKHQKAYEREIGFNRLLDLMRLMLDKSELLSQQVLNFLELLFQENHFLLVLRIVEELQNSSHINATLWIKRILNQKEGKGDIHYECIQSLYRIAKLSTYETFDVLEKIYKWSSTRNSNNSLSLSQANSILSILFFGNPLYGKYPLLNYGKWPSKFFLFNFNENNIKDTWSFLIKWLFHPNMVKAYRITDTQEYTSQISIEHVLTKVQTFIIESWYLILTGIDKIKLKPLQRKVINELTSSLIKELTPTNIKQLKRQLALMSSEYLREASKYKRKNNSQFTALFTAKKEACKTLYNKLNKL